MTEAELFDLIMLGMKRCRTAAMTVGQLLEDDEERASLLLSISADMIRGAAMILEREIGMDRDHALATALYNAISALGEENVTKAMRADVKPIRSMRKH